MRRPDRRGGRGQVVVLAAGVGLVCLLVVGLVVDYGQASVDKRRYQGLADNTAMSAAYLLGVNAKTANYTTDQASDSAYGLANEGTVLLGSTPVRTPSSPGASTYCYTAVALSGSQSCPASLPTPSLVLTYATGSTTGTVTATITATSLNKFMGLIGAGTTAVRATSTATYYLPHAMCTICAHGDVSVQGASSSISVTGGSLITTASDDNAINVGGSGSSNDSITVTGSGAVIGDYSGGDQCTSGCSPSSVNLTGTTFTDPYAGLAAPVQSTSFLGATTDNGVTYCTSSHNDCSWSSGGVVSCNGTCTFNPGVYYSMSFSSGAQVTLNPGVYVLTGTYSNGHGGTPGGFQVSGSQTVVNSATVPGDSVTGSGVMLYFTCPTYTTATPEACAANSPGDMGNNSCPSGLDVQSGTLDFSPPSTGTYQNLGVFYDPSDNAGICLQAGSDFTFGTIYATGSELQLQGGGSGSNGTTMSTIDVGGISVQGGSQLTVTTNGSAAALNTVSGGNPTLTG